MKLALGLAFATMAALASAAVAMGPVAIYVSPRGSDAWSGARPARASGGLDGPFATVQRAIAEVVRLNAAGGVRRPIDVVLAGGVYRLDAPIVLTPDASGAPGAPVTFRATRGARPVLSGGVRLTGWSRNARGWWTTSAPGAGGSAWRFMQLFVDGERRYRPRLPRTGYFTIEQGLPPMPANVDRGFDRIKYRAGDVAPGWTAPGDVEALLFQVWTMARLPVASVDAGERILSFGGTTCGTSPFFALSTGNRYLLDNVRDALGEPGDWYLDRDGTVTYVPMPGEKVEQAEIVAPRIERLLEVRGNAAAKRWVQHVVWRGIAFEHANWVTPAGGNASGQAEVSVGSAIQLAGARDFAFERCRMAHLGGYAIDIGAACKRCRVQSCEIVDLGAGGVRIGEQGYREDGDLLTSHNVVDNNRIAHGGRLHPAAVGVWLGHTPYNQVTRNDIADLYYTGVSVGWSWGYGKSQCHHNLIASNHIHTIGQGVLSDMGAIYTLGLAPGSVLRGNLIHEIDSFGYGGWGIYYDEGTTGMVSEDNVVYRTRSAGFHQHYGMDNVVRNNVFAFGHEAQLMRSRAEEHLSFTFEHNLVIWDEGRLLASNWSGSNYRLDNNVYWQAARKPFDFAGATLEKWRAKGQDVHSVVADPLFVNPARGDYRLRKGSPALAAGFRPFDVRDAGCRLPAERARVSAMRRAFPAPPAAR